MAAARTAARSAPRRQTSRRAKPRRRQPSGIRWDRLARVSLLVVLTGIVLLYVGPAHTWLVTWREAGAQRSEVAALTLEHKRLTARQQELQNPRALEQEARRLGMVKRTEHAYVIENLPDGS